MHSPSPDLHEYSSGEQVFVSAIKKYKHAIKNMYFLSLKSGCWKLFENSMPTYQFHYMYVRVGLKEKYLYIYFNCVLILKYNCVNILVCILLLI